MVGVLDDAAAPRRGGQRPLTEVEMIQQFKAYGAERARQRHIDSMKLVEYKVRCGDVVIVLQGYDHVSI